MTFIPIASTRRVRGNLSVRMRDCFVCNDDLPSLFLGPDEVWTSVGLRSRFALKELLRLPCYAAKAGRSRLTS